MQMVWKCRKCFHLQASCSCSSNIYTTEVLFGLKYEILSVQPFWLAHDVMYSPLSVLPTGTNPMKLVPDQRMRVKRKVCLPVGPLRCRCRTCGRQGSQAPVVECPPVPPAPACWWLLQQTLWCHWDHQASPPVAIHCQLLQSWACDNNIICCHYIHKRHSMNMFMS